MGRMKELAIEIQEREAYDKEEQLRQEQREEDEYQRQLTQEEFDFERDQGERQKI
ncbi:MAG: hypothetical protein NUV97_02675 [archaeon]|nr:hypothetical protein [archaeon]